MNEAKLMTIKPQEPEFGRDLPTDPMERLVFIARLAPSSHNAQPWRFVVEAEAIDVFAEKKRWLSVCDRDCRELFVSMGCALESLLIAADYEGFGSRTTLFPIASDESYVARVSIRFAGPKRDNAAANLVHAIATRHTSHRPFDPARSLSAGERKWLCEAVEDELVSLRLMDHGAGIAGVEALVAQAETTLFSDPDYREELGRWVGGGALGTNWLLSKLGQFAVAHLPVRDKVVEAQSKWLASAPHFGLIDTVDDRPASQVRAGQAFMRIALMCESHGIRLQPVSAPLEVASTRKAITETFDARGRQPQMFFRLGYAEAETARTSRRSLSQVMMRA
jgi:nitroreductase